MGFWIKSVCTTQGHIMHSPSSDRLCFIYMLMHCPINAMICNQCEDIWMNSYILPLQYQPLCKLFITICIETSITEALHCQMTAGSFSTALQVVGRLLLRHKIVGNPKQRSMVDTPPAMPSTANDQSFQVMEKVEIVSSMQCFMT